MISQLGDLIRERGRQNEKWGEQNHDPMIWLAILTEEVGEAAQDALCMRFGSKKASPEESAMRYRAECIQVAAVALAMVECIDRNSWKWPTQ